MVSAYFRIDAISRVNARRAHRYKGIAHTMVSLFASGPFCSDNGVTVQIQLKSASRYFQFPCRNVRTKQTKHTKSAPALIPRLSARLPSPISGVLEDLRVGDS